MIAWHSDNLKRRKSRQLDLELLIDKKAGMQIHQRITRRSRVVWQIAQPCSEVTRTHDGASKTAQPAQGPQHLLQLQRQYGNYFVQNLLNARNTPLKTNNVGMFTRTNTRTVALKAQPASCVAISSDHQSIVKTRKSKGLKTIGTLAFGITVWSPKNSATIPELKIDWRKSGKKWTGKVKPTTAAMGEVKALFLKPGTYKVPGKKVRANFPQCGSKGKRVPFFSVVGRDMSNLAKLAEQEHCNDYQRAFDLTLKKWAGFINATANQPFGPGTKPTVRKKIQKTLKQKGNKTRQQWITELNRLNRLSTTRDINGWHSLKPDGPPINCPADCSKLVGHTVKTVFTRVPGPPSRDLIK